MKIERSERTHTIWIYPLPDRKWFDDNEPVIFITPGVAEFQCFEHWFSVEEMETLILAIQEAIAQARAFPSDSDKDTSTPVPF